MDCIMEKDLAKLIDFMSIQTIIPEEFLMIFKQKIFKIFLYRKESVL
mgnify:CR=1 FL=1